MFGLPNAKRVRRDELQSPTSSPRSSPDPELSELFRSHVRDEYTFDASNAIATNDIGAENTRGEEEEETELILFAAPPTTTPQSHKIRLQSPDAGSGEPGIAVKRPRSYYFARDITSEKEAEYRAAAVDTGTVVAMSHMPWPGCALPWKVRTISAGGMKNVVLVGHPKAVVTIEDAVQRRRRKGKKSRIALRKKMKGAEEKRAEVERLKREKDEAEKEKRTKKNREKKVKKRAREKAKKLADGAGEDMGQDAEDNET